jgi:hypothetical protein
MIELRGILNGAAALSVAAVLATTAPGAASAQGATGDEWLPWLGCWHATDTPADAPLTCVHPLVGGGIEMLAVAEGGVLDTRTIRADGAARSATVGGCPATEWAELSADGSRIYLQAELACPDEPVRVSRGMIAMMDHARWIEVQAMEVRGRTVAWVQRYEPASRDRARAVGEGDLIAYVDSRSGLIGAARAVAASPITVDQIIEAHGRTDPEAVRVWIAEQLRPLRLDADGLRRLADAGVSDEVIDVAVAVAYPEQFAVTHDEPHYPRARGPRGPVRPPMYPPMYPGWDPYYSYWGRGWGGYYRPTVIVVSPRDGSRSTARAVKGRGYTRGTGATSDGASSGQPGAARGTRRAGTASATDGATSPQPDVSRGSTPGSSDAPSGGRRAAERRGD